MASVSEESKVRARPDDSDNCWICYVSYAEDKERNFYKLSGNGWVAPCKCKGSSMWVHQECLQAWIDEKQNGDTSRSVRCHQCHTPYRYKFPPLGIAATSIQFIENIIDLISPYACFCGATATGYLVLTGYGYLTLMQVMGINETAQFYHECEPIIFMIFLPCIPIGLTAFKLIRFEDLIFNYLKQHIPPFILKILGAKLYNQYWPQAPRVPTAIATRRRLSWPRAIITGLMLPSIASLIGRLYFYNVESNLKRSFLGGLTYLSFRCLTKLYFKYRHYQNMCHREILNYSDSV